MVSATVLQLHSNGAIMGPKEAASRLKEMRITIEYPVKRPTHPYRQNNRGGKEGLSVFSRFVYRQIQS
jgi:hypothetical protein